MSILSSVMSILEFIKIRGVGFPREESNPTKPDDGGDGKQSKWNDHHNGHNDYSSKSDNDDYSNLSGKYVYSKQGDADVSKDGKDDTYHNPGEVLAKFDFSHGDFSHGDFGSDGPDHSDGIQGALASMSSDDALEYAIGQMGPADHFDVGHFDLAADTSHDTDA